MGTHEGQSLSEILLPDHHRHLEVLIEELKSQAQGDDRAAMRDAWVMLEEELLADVAAEEEHILPAFADAYPREAAAIREDHLEIGRLLAELCVSVDLKRFSPGLADALVERLRAHARREDALMYPWAAAHLPRWRHFLDRLLRRGQTAA